MEPSAATFCLWIILIIFFSIIEPGDGAPTDRIKYDKYIYLKKGEKLSANWKVLIPSGRYYTIRILYNTLPVLSGNNTAFRISDKAVKIFGESLKVDIVDKLYKVGVDFRRLPDYYRSAEDIFVVHFSTHDGSGEIRKMTTVVFDCDIDHKLSQTNVACAIQYRDRVKAFPKVIAAITIGTFLFFIFLFGAWILRHQRDHFRHPRAKSTLKGASDRSFSLTSVTEMLPRAKKKIIEKTLEKACVMDFTKLLIAAILPEDQVVEFFHKGKPTKDKRNNNEKISDKNEDKEEVDIKGSLQRAHGNGSSIEPYHQELHTREEPKQENARQGKLESIIETPEIDRDSSDTDHCKCLVTITAQSVAENVKLQSKMGTPREIHLDAIDRVNCKGGLVVNTDPQSTSENNVVKTLTSTKGNNDTELQIISEEDILKSSPDKSDAEYNKNLVHYV